jgi:hypothetical protein
MFILGEQLAFVERAAVYLQATGSDPEYGRPIVTEASHRTQDPQEPRSWFCQQCNRTLKLEEVEQRSWGTAIAVICPTCDQRLGEIRFHGQTQMPHRKRRR